ncbi:M23/M56 family metallopeptidase [Aestuariibacter halophilus]|uniref:M23/M56 family metallopeptidase n=1 Tax=Fluctibacter halophilus TaxID=226011 RepID=A0ABS8GCS2_9ALTE|nr:M23/M56 family metallopeptidase [Aestuariibacter halophilus]MCC2618199.1 M23/M56 family metallopeptidase [Aestuariibacter halophilus]
MELVFLNPLMGLILQILIWSLLVSLIVHASIRWTPMLQYWSAVWKVALLICLLPLIPWSVLALPAFQVPIDYPLLPTMPALWQEGLTLTQPSAHDLAESPAQTALAHVIGLTTLFILIVSLIKTLGFGYQLVRFNRSLASLERIDINAPEMTFLTLSQRAALRQSKVRLCYSSAPLSPFTAGIIHPVIVLPNSFFTLPQAQQRLLLEHELTHIKRRDVLWLMLSQLSGCLLWFAPALQTFRRKLNLAVEVECDRSVLQTFPELKKDYGRALLNMVRHINRPVASQAAFFNNQQFSDLKQRITFTQKTVQTFGDKPMNKCILGLSALIFSATSWAMNSHAPSLMPVEDFIALHHHASRHIDHKTPNTTPTGIWVNPVKTAWVSSSFKAKQAIREYKPHLGIDLAANSGEAIVAAGDGIVIIADSQSLHKNHGNVVVIDHGNGILTMYSHLERFTVEKGATVKAGQQIGSVGTTGKTTGPHLHFEVIANDRHIDPAALIAFNSK